MLSTQEYKKHYLNINKVAIFNKILDYTDSVREIYLWPWKSGKVLKVSVLGVEGQVFKKCLGHTPDFLK